MWTRMIKSGPLYRPFELNRAAINEEARTVDLAFSSETPVERDFGDEILDHGKTSIRMGRMNDGGPLLMDHDPRDHIGTVESANVGPDKVARARVRFSKSARGEEVWQDVLDGIRKHVSVGYRIHRMQREETDEREAYRAVDWEPYEISLVSVPADYTGAGIGRDDAAEPHTIIIDDNRKEEDTMAEKTPAVESKPDVDVQAITNQARDAEIKRIRDLEKMGEKYAQFGGADLAREMIREGKTLSDMKDAVLERLPKEVGTRQEDVPASQLDLSEKQVQKYSLLRAVQASISKDWSKAGFELECSREIAERTNKDPKGFFVPFDVLDGTRATTTTTGAGAVGTDHLAGSFIDALRAQSVAMSLGATVLDGLVGDVSIPKLTTGGTFYWVAEDGAVTSGDAAVGSVTLSPKTIGAAVPITRRLLKQSAPSIEAMLMNDLRQGAALGIDLAALEGGGVNEPTGIINTTGVGTQTIAAALGTGYPTWDELVGFETAVGNANALEGALAYVTTSAIAGGMKITAKDSGSGLFLMEGGQANGYPVAIRNGLTAKSIIFGNFSDLLIGMWGVLDVMPDEATDAAKGGLVLRVFQDVDVGVRHAESFCING